MKRNIIMFKVIDYLLISALPMLMGMALTINLNTLVPVNPEFHGSWLKVALSAFGGLVMLPLWVYGRARERKAQEKAVAMTALNMTRVLLHDKCLET
jgi:hypothetical protein